MIIRLLYILVFLPCFLLAQNNPGFLGRKNTVKLDFGLNLVSGVQPHGATGDEFAYSFFPDFIKLSPRIGVSYERILNRNVSVTGGLHRYTSYAFNRNLTVTETYDQGWGTSNINRSLEPLTDENFRTVNTQLSLGFRFYSNYAPLNYYFELGGTGIFYSSESVTYVYEEENNPDGFSFNETITPSGGINFMGYLAFGLHEFITDDIFIGFDLRVHIRTLGMVLGIDDSDEFRKFVNDEERPLDERLNKYNQFHSMINIGLGFTISAGYVF